MITLLRASDSTLLESQMFPIKPDKPKVGASLSKLIYFLIREGLVMTTSKVLARINKQDELDK